MTKASEKVVHESKWDSSFAFLMAMIGAAVGLGNIWRFSYVVYSNGGGAFFIPYFTAIFLMGIPFLIMEYGLGYKFKDSLSNILRKVKPQFEVVGWFAAFLVFLVLTYYVVIMGWDLIYLILSFFKGWGSDPNMYFNNNIVVGGNDLSNLFTLVMPVTFVTIIIWAVLWFISHKNLNDGVSRVVKVLIPLLFVVIAIIVVYALTLPGHMIGLTSLFNPDWSALLNVDIWLAAFGQIVFSLSMGQAIAVTYASYLPNKTKLTDNVLIVAASNSGFEIFTSLGVFSILGFMTFSTAIPVNELATSGSGLLFIVFPEIFNTMGSVSYIIGPLFFLCVLFAGVTSALAFIEPMSNSISMKFGWSRKKTVSVLCIIGLLISLIYTTGSGNYILTVADEYINQFGILLGVVLQAIIFGWYYGLEKLLPVLNNNTSIKVGKKWIFVLKVVLPILLSIMWIIGIVDLFMSESTTTLMIEFIITVIFIAVPVILSYLPQKVVVDENYHN